MKPTLIIGASPRSSSYANMAMHALKEAGHKTLLYNPTGRKVDDREVYTTINEIDQEIHTITLYVRPSRLAPIVEELIALNAERIIFNPGTEDPAIIQAFQDAGLQALEACTLVMLRTQQY
ncbi:predicted CoA-binding protein [Lentisphaera araneosa HTCC2155]|uniref:Predicted CoA-binding protein n=1 Tax=Lentisphaera araneosa HTCC2155 TaxID=313628 RepID=A6DJ13_9BACT|nr:CoA-binding protein [Lentisphaera araneosa]EDM28449.1 predicted CoA-binding protein [Lentisphaera araneosa HTCC2155]